MIIIIIIIILKIILTSTLEWLNNIKNSGFFLNLHLSIDSMSYLNLYC